MQIRAAQDVPVAVLCARYSGHRSRTLLWSMDTDVFVPGQWLKGGVEVLDVSPNGQYMAYYAQTFHRPIPSYFAISRPPFLKALDFRPVRSCSWCDAIFLDDRTYEWVGSPLSGSDWCGDSPYNRPRQEKGCPLIQKAWRGKEWPDLRLLDRETSRPGVRNAIERYGSGAAALLESPIEGIGIFPAADAILAETRTAIWDWQSRLIVVDGWRVLAFSEDSPEGVELIDLSGQTFDQVAAPGWARTWSLNAKRL